VEIATRTKEHTKEKETRDYYHESKDIRTHRGVRQGLRNHKGEEVSE
jgi:hypothetical protein